MALPSQRRAGRTLLLFVVVAVALGGQPARADNTYLAGGIVRLSAPVAGDLAAAGGRVSVDQDVSGDATLAAGSVSVAGAIGDDLRAAGGEVVLEGKVSGELLAAGGNVELAPFSTVAQHARVAGGKVTIAGKIGGKLEAYAGSIDISGEISGDARLVGRDIELLPTARIKGKLSYASPNAIKADPAAVVSGGIERSTGPYEHMPRHEWYQPHRVFRPIMGLGLLAAGTLLLLLFPNFNAAALAALGAKPWISLGLGAALFFTIPFVVLFLIITIIGIPVALATLALYGVLILVGYLTSLLYIGERAIRSVRKETPIGVGQRVLALAVTLIIMALIGVIPFVGTVLIFLALLFGIGALMLALHERYRHAAAPS